MTWLAEIVGADRYQGRVEALDFTPALTATMISLDAITLLAYAVIFSVYMWFPNVAWRSRAQLSSPFIAATISQSLLRMTDILTLFVGAYYVETVVMAALSGVIAVIAWTLLTGVLRDMRGKP